MRRRDLLITLAALFFGISHASSVCLADDPAVNAAADRGVQFLKTKIGSMNSGEAGIAALAMKKADVPVNDPGFVACVTKFGGNFNGTTYTPETKGGAEIYEATVAILAMVAIDPTGYKPYIEAAADYILRQRKANGSWDYSNRNAGDTSITQYALLGLWEAENVGVLVSAQVWDQAAKWYISVQGSNGSFNYHRDEPGWPETVAMTGAGVGSLMLCQNQLQRHRKGQEQLNPLMTPLVIDGMAAELRYKVETSSDSVNKAIRAGVKWMSDNFQASNAEIVGQSIFYCLYGIERVGALGHPTTATGLDLAPTMYCGDSSKSIPEGSIYKRGVQYVLAQQKASGAWDGVQHKEIPNTCWALLYLKKATTKSIQRIEIRRLGSARLKGNRNLPTNLDDVEVVGGELVTKPMGGAVEGMLAALEDVKGVNAESAVAGLVEVYNKQGPKGLRPQKERFRKMLNDPDPGVRMVAAWGMGRCGDLEVAPALIKALLDPDDKVMEEARVSLQVLSRKLEGYGPNTGATLEEREAAAKRWLVWFESVKPPDLDTPDSLPVSAPKTPAQ